MMCYKLLCVVFLISSAISSPVFKGEDSNAIPEEVKSIIERFKSKIEVYKSLHSPDPNVTPKVSLKDFIQDKIKARSMSKRSIDFPQRFGYWNHASSSLSGGGESPFDSYFASMAKDFKSKIMETVTEKKEFIESKVQNKLKMLSDAFNFSIDADDDNTEDAEEIVAPERVESSELAPAVYKSPEAVSEPIAGSINQAITAKVQGSTDVADGEMDQAILKGLVVKALNEYRPKVKQLNETRKSFFSALGEMKAAAAVLDEPSVTTEKTAGTEIASEIKRLQDVMSFKAKLREMISKKTQYVTQKEQLRSEVYGTMQNLFAVSRNLTGQPFSFLDALASVLNEEASKKLLAAGGNAVVPGSVGTSGGDTNAGSGGSQIIDTVPLVSGGSSSASGNPGNVASQGNIPETVADTVSTQINQANPSGSNPSPAIGGTNGNPEESSSAAGGSVEGTSNVNQASFATQATDNGGAQPGADQTNPTGFDSGNANAENPSIPAVPSNQGAADDSVAANAGETTGNSQAISSQVEAGQAIPEETDGLNVESQSSDNQGTPASGTAPESQPTSAGQSTNVEEITNAPSNPPATIAGVENDNSETIAARLIQSLEAQGQGEQAVVPENAAESEGSQTSTSGSIVVPDTVENDVVNGEGPENVQIENPQAEASGSANIQSANEPVPTSSEPQNAASGTSEPAQREFVEEAQSESEQAIASESNPTDTNRQAASDAQSEVTENLNEASPAAEASDASEPLRDATSTQSEADQIVPNDSDTESAANQPQNNIATEGTESNPTEAATTEDETAASEAPSGKVSHQAEIIAQMAEAELDQVSQAEDTNQEVGAVAQPETQTTPETQPQVAPETQPPVAPETQPPVAPETQTPVTPETQPSVAPETQPPVAPEAQPPVAPETQPEAAILPISNDTIISSIDEAITAEVQGSSNSIQTAMNEAIIRGLALEVLKDFEPKIQSLNETRQEFFGSLAEMAASAAELGNVSATTNLTEAEGMSNETFEALMAYKAKLGDLILKKNEYNAAKTLLKNEVTAALQNLSATAENLTGDPLSFVDALAALRSSNTSLFTILNEDTEGKLSGVQGLDLAALQGGSNGGAFANPTVVGVIVAGCLAIVAAVALIGVVVVKRRRRHNIYTHLPGESLVYSSSQNYGSNSTTVLE